MAAPNQMTCPFICPVNRVEEPKAEYLEAGMSRGEGSGPQPYKPGEITPWVPAVRPKDNPPLYLPQPTDSSSGDILSMKPIGPWAPGHVDWSPQAGMVGVRPVVDKYSITRYASNEWRKTNEQILRGIPNERGLNLELDTEQHIQDVYNGLLKKNKDSNNKLEQKTKTLKTWKDRVQKALDDITEEVQSLDEYRAKLKGACRILMMPEAISRECLELRTFRYEPDLVRDDAEQELIKEVAIVGEIRRVFQDLLVKTNDMMDNLKAAKASIESDWSDKMVTLKYDKMNLKMDLDSSLLQRHPGVARWPENATSLEYWEHYCSESVRNCDEVREKSKKFRADLLESISKGSQDMKTQADRTNAALAETVSATEGCCEQLEETLRTNLKQTVGLENLIDKLNENLREAEKRDKLSMTRLFIRNYQRPNVENCRDEAQYALMAEAKYVKESCEGFRDRIRRAETMLAELMKYRGDLEKQIACKRKSLLIDQDRFSRLRAFMPTPEEFAAA